MTITKTYPCCRITKLCLTFIVLVVFTKKQYAQCTWSNLLFDSFEYSQSTTSPDFIPGVNYGVAHPDTYAAHSGSQSVYINFIDSNLISPPEHTEAPYSTGRQLLFAPIHRIEYRCGFALHLQECNATLEFF